MGDPDRPEAEEKIAMTLQESRETMPPKVAGSAAASLEPVLQDHIGRQLRAIYDEVLHEPVPDRFVQLLNQLAAKKGSDA